MTTATSGLTEFHWTTQPQAAALVGELLNVFLARCPAATRFAERLKNETGTRLIDWVDYFLLSDDKVLPEQLRAAGFEPDSSGYWYRHPAGLFPMMLVDGQADGIAVIVKVESVVDFLVAHRLSDGREILGQPVDAMRCATAFTGDRAEMRVMERHGFRVDHKLPRTKPTPVLQVAEMFRLRPREFDDAADGFTHAADLIDSAIKLVGVDRAADLFFAAEREYWMRRNRAAQVQFARQQALGMGWANHDHHTYRSSRLHFKDLVAMMEKLGLTCRERFYAGGEAGWGAQVMEQPNSGIVVFADVDLSPEEVTGDFAHEPLPPRDRLGTVGLWCELHGEAFLEAGMHHLECQFDYEAQRKQLQETGVNSMKPFTYFPYLKQAFTEGEIWPVNPRRIDALVVQGLITMEQAEKFRRDGALGSHLEVLQRDDGYKGFNQTGINEIITKTDPRHAAVVAGD